MSWAGFIPKIKSLLSPLKRIRPVNGSLVFKSHGLDLPLYCSTHVKPRVVVVCDFFHSQPCPSERGLLPHQQLQEPSTSQEHSIPAFQAEEGAALARFLPLPQTESSSYIKFINSWQERNPPIGRNRCSTSNFCHHDSVPNIIVLKCGGMLIFFLNVNMFWAAFPSPSVAYTSPILPPPLFKFPETSWELERY